MKKINYLGLLVLPVTILFYTCGTNSADKEHKACFEVPVVRNSKLIKVDSCFTAPTKDSLEMLVNNFKEHRDAAKEAYDTKLYFVIIDTIGKKPEEYEYGIVVSDAGVINPEVILTNDQDMVKEKINSYIKENIIYKKLNSGETMEKTVETIFKTNIRIHYRREGGKKLKH